MVERVAKKKKAGRPTLYKPQYSQEVERLCKLGVVDKDIALFFNVSIDAVQAWARKYPEFYTAMARGKLMADTNVAAALYKNAEGYYYEEEYPVKLSKITRDMEGNEVTQQYVKIITLKKYAKADTTAQIFFLKNRRPDQWREKKYTEDETPVDKKVFRGIIDLKKEGFVELEGEYTVIGKDVK